MENTNRNVFGIDGIAGMLIATVLLLSILVFLTVWGMNTQHANAGQFYKVENADQLKMISHENQAHRVLVK